ncbi:MAG: putative fluoride ion transporter CrcB [Chitinophagales bacterium]|nr:MAG: putative fluoride ion transporter CrcB [Chitinophagales bacterium]
MRLLLIIGAGSFMGGIFRFLLSRCIQEKIFTSFPLGTLSVNIIGCFLIGCVFGLSEKSDLSQEWRLFMVTGLCGGFTTFSAFSQETLSLLRDGQYAYAGIYVGASLLLGLISTLAGIYTLKLL